MVDSSKIPPLDAYRALVNSGDLLKDPLQEAAIQHLNKLYLDIQSGSDFFFISWLFDLFGFSKGKNKFKGFYFWGGVGRGKTMLMDLFFKSLPADVCQRYHFHRFMQRIHQEFKFFSGKKNPAKEIAAKLSDETSVICFDEFYVSDIADAMILAELLKELFELGVILVATSNIAPKDLYLNGLQRAKFLPAIDLLYKHTNVVLIAAGQDFRLRKLTDAKVFHSPSGEGSSKLMDEAFASLADSDIQIGSKIWILGRSIKTLKESAGLVWFDFSELCEGARSQNDYIEISKIYQSVFLSGLRVLTEQHESAARRFISLIDEFYDRGVKLVIEAEVGIEDIYQGRRLIFEFQRTKSRLQEMQSLDYLSKEHR